MNWTDEQSRAVTFRGNNVLVSAGAGAGKTAVLVERIKKQVIDERVSITKILVVTFTNAAALEMKKKVRSAVLKELEATESGNRSERTYLSEQLRNFGSAYISTFHSFALGIIRKYYYICGLSPNFKVAEQCEFGSCSRQASRIASLIWSMRMKPRSGEPAGASEH